MAFSVSDQAMIGQFPFSDQDSPLVKMNKTFLDNIDKDKDSSMTNFQLELQSTKNNLERIQLFSKYFEFESCHESKVIGEI